MTAKAFVLESGVYPVNDEREYRLALPPAQLPPCCYIVLVQREPPDRHYFDASGIDLYQLFLTARDDGTPWQFQFGHGLGKRGNFALAGLRVGHRFADLDKHPGRIPSTCDKIHFPALSGPVVEDVRRSAVSTRFFRRWPELMRMPELMELTRA